MDYYVTEDKAGGLHLFVFEGEDCLFARSAYEQNPGQLLMDITALGRGEDPRRWEGGSNDPKAKFDELEQFPIGLKVVAERVGNRSRLFPERMGTAAMKEFFG